MKKLLILLVYTSILPVFADNGDITITNNNTQFDNKDTIRVQIIPAHSGDTKPSYIRDISAIAPNNQITLNKSDFDKVQEFDVYIADASQNGAYRRCLKNMPYHDNREHTTLSISNTGKNPSYNQCVCTYHGSIYPCEYGVSTYQKIRGSAKIPW